jgi:uncharacterized protein (TIGR02594 family)
MDMKWFEIAKGEVGQHEVAGGEHNPRIVEYHQTTSLKATTDEVPWCSSFVNWCMAKAGIKGTGSAAAKSWLSWGVPCDPKTGCVVVIRQKVAGKDAATGSATGYHVGFLATASPTHIGLLGGNQSDSVKVSNFPWKSYTVEGYRWPVSDSA